MKFLKYIFIVLLAIILVVIIGAFMTPSNYDVSRSKVIKAPVSTVFNQVNDYKNWKNWGPWFRIDTTITTTFPEKTKGIGGSYKWNSKTDGNGSMKTIALVENTSIDQKMILYENESDVLWKFTEEPEGTKVTWQMKEDDAPFVFRFFALISGGWDGMLGSMLEDGLKNLDEVATENNN